MPGLEAPGHHKPSEASDAHKRRAEECFRRTAAGKSSDPKLRAATWKACLKGGEVGQKNGLFQLGPVVIGTYLALASAPHSREALPDVVVAALVLASVKASEGNAETQRERDPKFVLPRMALFELTQKRLKPIESSPKWNGKAAPGCLWKVESRFCPCRRLLTCSGQRSVTPRLWENFAGEASDWPRAT